MKTRFLIAALALAAMASCMVESPETAPVPDTTKVFRASIGEDNTRTHLDVGTSAAKVIWDAGDEIQVVGMLPNGSYYPATFATSTGGSASAEFACHSWAPNTSIEYYLSMYPADRFIAVHNDPSMGGILFGVSLPSVQTAVNGGVERGMLLSIAKQHDTMANDLKFENILSLVRFRLSGSSASKVKRVLFTATTAIAGDGVYILNDTDPHFDFSIYFPPATYETSTTVELSGMFEAGGDYYIVVPPCVTDGFTMNFIDAGDNILARSSSKTVEFKRSHIADLGTIVLDEEFGAPSDKVVKYMESSSGFKPVVLAVLADGFTSGQQQLFLSLAKGAVDKLFDTEPYKTYKDYFTVYLLPVVSNEAGASITNGSGTVTTKVDNYFGSGWGESNYMDMNADKSKIQGYLQTNLPELIRGTHTLDEISSALIINDARYGGICHMFSNGFSYAMVPYTNDGGELAWGFPGTRAASESDVSAGTRATTSEERDAIGVNHGDWRNTLIHEFGGHGIGRLGDEYWGDTYVTSTTIDSHNWPVPFSLNVSAVYDDVPWKAALLDNLSILTSIDSRYARIGRYQGGEGYILNRWRSEVISCMIDNRQYFSTWQRILIVTRIKSLAGDSFSLNDFVNADVTRDPVRDGSSASSAARLSTHTAPLRLYPPLAPPVLHEE